MSDDHTLTVHFDGRRVEVFSDGERIVDPVDLDSSKTFTLEIPTDRKVDRDDLERDPDDLGLSGEL